MNEHALAEVPAAECRRLGCTMPPLEDGLCVRCGEGPGRGPDMCPADCGRRKHRSHLMCGYCWRSVSPTLQQAVLSSWRRWRRCPSDAELLERYRENTRAAVREVTGR